MNWRMLGYIVFGLLVLFVVYLLFISPRISCTGDECFPKEDFPQQYRNCGITSNRIPTEVAIKDCIWDAYMNCQEAYAKINYYGVEGQTGVSDFIIVEKAPDGECHIKQHTNEGDNIINERVCNNNINKTYWKENCERGKTIRGECYKDSVTCSEDCPADYFLSDGYGTSCQSIFR